MSKTRILSSELNFFWGRGTWHSCACFLVVSPYIYVEEMVVFRENLRCFLLRQVGFTPKYLNGWMDGETDEWMDGQMNAWIDSVTRGSAVHFTQIFLVLFFYQVVVFCFTQRSAGIISMLLALDLWNSCLIFIRERLFKLGFNNISNRRSEYQSPLMWCCLGLLKYFWHDGVGVMDYWPSVLSECSENAHFEKQSSSVLFYFFLCQSSPSSPFYSTDI